MVLSQQETEKKYYTPPVSEQPVKLGLDKEQTQYSKDLTALGGSDGIIEMRLEQSVIMERLSKDIYKDFKSGFRELFANAVSACILAQQLFQAKPRIEIVINPKTRELTIREFDSIGMSTEVFKEVYTVVGRSGNFDGTRPGQFGFGRLAWVTLSDRMILETHYRTKDGKTGKYAVQGQNAISFVVLPKPNLNTFGTTVKLILYKEISIEGLVKYITNACEMSKIDTYLTLTSSVRDQESPEDEDNDEDWDDNGNPAQQPPTIKAGTIKLSKTYHEKADAYCKWLTKQYGRRGVSILKEYTLTGDGWEVYGAFLTQKETSGLTELLTPNNNGTYTYLVGLPIEADILLPFTVSYVNVVDERKFQPTADRERLKDKAVEELSSQIESEVTKAFAPLNVRNLVEYLKLPVGDRLIICQDDEDFTRHLDQATVNTIATLVGYVKWKNAEQYKKRTWDRDSVSKILASVPSVERLFVERARFVDRHDHIIFTLCPDAIIVNCRDNDRTAELLVGAGARIAKDYIKTIPKSQRPKPFVDNTGKVASRYITTYTASNYYRTTPDAESVQTLPSNAIRIPRSVGLDAYKRVLASGVETKYVLVSDNKDFGDKGLKFDDFVAAIAKTKVETNNGAMTIADLPKTPKLTLTQYDNEKVVRLLNNKGDIVIGTADRLFEIMFYRTYKGLQYKLDTDASTIFNASLPHKFVDNSYTNDSEDVFNLITIYFAVKNKDLAMLLMNAYENDRDSTMKTLFTLTEILDESVMKQIKP
jgi:hypothetical protein